MGCIGHMEGSWVVSTRETPRDEVCINWCTCLYDQKFWGKSLFLWVKQVENQGKSGLCKGATQHKDMHCGQ